MVLSQSPQEPVGMDKSETNFMVKFALVFLIIVIIGLVTVFILFDNGEYTGWSKPQCIKQSICCDSSKFIPTGNGKGTMMFNLTGCYDCCETEQKTRNNTKALHYLTGQKNE